ncbi:hypothetical protein CTAYLR_009763 [Chrysophaeum taylorii]|uniref:Uncharacterized protein n=1 Tax=Chrysophaeum taylorii TaxID=2483200 RepID=A0AAD7XM90_9STRA|nr:hypothetical protein CTAYLR_009763 [Chrysophaeum taylorii]
MVTRVTAKRMELQVKFRRDFTTDQLISEHMSRYYGADYPGAALLFSFIERDTYETIIQMLADHECPDLAAVNPPARPDLDDRRAGLVYYLAGWLCYKVKQAAPRSGRCEFWNEWLGHNALTSAEAQRFNLPSN